MDASMIREAATVEAEAEALDWIIRIRNPDFAEWDALTAWLAADPRHADIFQELALWDEALATADDLSAPPRRAAGARRR
jgi:transmembrane sensor